MTQSRASEVCHSTGVNSKKDQRRNFGETGTKEAMYRVYYWLSHCEIAGDKRISQQ
jgi:hypothetical protein